ncbi:MAG: PTS glucose transporter subunit IIA [Actinomycetaceae bacterium]|nr:PTS glucose transporter subunit IIA [Actinomycetaceae bacterium]
MLIVGAPVSGRIMSLRDVPDPVFAASMMGPGCVVEPQPGVLTVLAPCSGTVTKAMPHGCVIAGDGGMSILVHMGIDTVELQGRGFTSIATEGGRIEAGQPIATWDTGPALEGGYSLCTPVVAMGVDPADTRVVAGARVEAGDPLFGIAAQ